MLFNLLTLFPEFFDSPLACALLGKAQERGLLRVERIDPRTFTTDRHRTVDDRPYGGGPGMVMLPEPLDMALASLTTPGRKLLMAPSGRPLTQEYAEELSREPVLTLVCGRYEGVDARILELHDLEPVSVGDYVLGGGEAAALCVIEAVSRLLEGFMGHCQSGEEESFSNGLLEYPHYTRPEAYKGLDVPEVLLSGDHKRVARWRREQSLEATLRQRPELLAEAPLDDADLSHLRGLLHADPTAGSRLYSRLSKNLHLVLAHYPVLDREKKVATVSLTNLDLHDIARCSRAYQLGGFFVATPLEDQRALAEELLAHWTQGAGRKANPDRGCALERVQVVGRIEDAVAAIQAAFGCMPKVVVSSARGTGGLLPAQVRAWLENEPVLLVLGTGHGLAPQVTLSADGALRPIRPLSDYNHLPVRAAAVVYLDRILGDW